MILFSVLYHPGENVINNIILAARCGFNSFVYLNCADRDFVDRLNKINGINGIDITIMGNNSNVGLGVAFNELEICLSEIGEDYYVYFDQDTVTNEDAWRIISGTYRDFFSNKKSGMVFYGNKKGGASRLVVSSGCVFSMEVIRRIGGHDPGYFVEGVDYEFCLRLKASGYIIYNAFVEGVDHLSLQDGVKFDFAGLSVPVRIYGESRTKDFNASHAKLIRCAFQKNEYWMVFVFLRSFIIFNFREYFSRIIFRFLR